MEQLKLLSWNVAGRTNLLPRQAEAVVRQAPDIVALQEVRASTLPRWSKALAKAGLVHVLDSSQFTTRRLFNLTASRWELTEMAPIGSPQPERVLSAVGESPFGLVEIHNAHVPPARPNDLTKVEVCEALHHALARPSARHRVLCGDLNSPRRETEHGEVETFAENHPGHEERWDAAERSLLTGLSEWGMRDSFRALHGYDRGDVSWVFHTRSMRKAAHRLDHVIASDELGAVYCDYQHGWREAGLSDHSAIEAIFSPRGG